MVRISGAGWLPPSCAEQLLLVLFAFLTLLQVGDIEERLQNPLQNKAAHRRIAVRPDGFVKVSDVLRELQCSAEYKRERAGDAIMACY